MNKSSCLRYSFFLLCLALVCLSGCAGVKVSTLDTEQYMELRRGDVLTRGELSSYTGSALQVLGLERETCEDDGEPCRAALYTTTGMSQERRLSALSEMWLYEAMLREKQKAGTAAISAAYLEAARFAYAYLFHSERPMSMRTLEERPTQVRDYYNFSVQQALSKIFEERLSAARPDGKESITEFRVLERQAGYTKLALTPVTGRTHQLRVHCAYKGFPILGDPQYGNGSGDFGLAHQMLCAKRLEFTHPVTGQKLLLESNMDATI